MPWRFGFQPQWLVAAVLFLVGSVLLLLVAPTAEPSSDPNVAPWWLTSVAGMVLVLAGLGVVLPKRSAIVAFALLFVIAALATVFFPFRPGELHSTIELFTPFGFFARRLGDTPTRIIAAVVSLFAIGLIATAVPQMLKDEFGERRWLSAIQGVGLLIVVPFLFALIAILVVTASPILVWRFIEQRRARNAGGVVDVK